MRYGQLTNITINAIRCDGCGKLCGRLYRCVKDLLCEDCFLERRAITGKCEICGMRVEIRYRTYDRGANRGRSVCIGCLLDNAEVVTAK